MCEHTKNTVLLLFWGVENLLKKHINRETKITQKSFLNRKIEKEREERETESLENVCFLIVWKLRVRCQQ